MTHNFPIVTAKAPCRTARAHPSTPAPRGTAGAFVLPSRAFEHGIGARDFDWENMRCRAFVAGGDP